jgi:hypothetical protein
LKTKLQILATAFVILVSVKHSLAQPFLTLDASQVFSTFKFSSSLNQTNAESGAPAYSNILSNGVGLGYEYVTSKGIIIGGGLGLRKGGASLVYKKMDYTWNLQYVDLKAAIGYQYDKWRLKPFVSVMPYYAYLISAKQSIGLNYYDIKTDNSIKNYDLGVFANAGVKVALSPYFSVYTNYCYNLALKNIETTTGQTLYNRGFAVKLGVAFSITNYKKAQDELQQQHLLQQNNGIINPENGSSTKNVSNETVPNNGINQQSNSNQSGTNSTTGQTIESPGTVGWGTSTKNGTQKNEKAEPFTKVIDPVNEPLSNNKNVATQTSNNNTVTTKSENSNTNQTNNNTNKTAEPDKNTTSQITASNNSKVKTPESATNNVVNSSNSNSSNTVVPLKNTTDNVTTSNNSNSNNANNSNSKTNKNSDVKNEKSKPVLNNTKNPKNNIEESIVFKIQLTAVKNSLRPNHPIFKDKNLKGGIQSEKGKDGWIRYFVGSFKTYEAAHAELNRLKTKGIAEGGFVVAFKDGKKITVLEAKELIE